MTKASADVASKASKGGLVYMGKHMTVTGNRETQIVVPQHSPICGTAANWKVGVDGRLISPAPLYRLYLRRGVTILTTSRSSRLRRNVVSTPAGRCKFGWLRPFCCGTQQAQ
jgi:hypothetical protein